MLKIIKCCKKLSFIIFFISQLINSQQSLLSQIDNDDQNISTTLSAFKAHKVINGQSTKQSKEKELYLYVAHRFGDINDGLSTLFGLDIANTKIEIMYGITDNLQIGLSRESLKKTYSLNLKNKIFHQHNSFPVNISVYNSFNYNSSNFLAPGLDLSFSQRSLFLSQILISSRISEKFTFQMSPSYIRRNYNEQRILFENGEVIIENGIPVFTTYERRNNYVLGLASSYKINKRTALNIEYFSNLNRVKNSPNLNTLSIGVDLETGGHVFQLIFSNTQSIDDISVLTDAEGNWDTQNIFFGFNILRVF